MDLRSGITFDITEALQHISLLAVQQDRRLETEKCHKEIEVFNSALK